MPALLVDYSFTHPPVTSIKAAGYAGAMRYLAPPELGGAKVLTAAERDALLLSGLSIGLVWETYARRAAKGQAAGAEDAQAAEAMAKALGMPTSVPIFYAVDFDTTAAVVTPYFAGVREAATRPRGVYGGIKVVDPLMAADPALYGWQACAWSAGKVSARAHLYQRLRATVRRPLAGTDENVLLRPLPMWALTASRGSSAPTSPVPQATPAPTPPVDVVAYARRGTPDYDAAAWYATARTDAVVATSSLQLAKELAARGARVLAVGGPAAADLAGVPGVVTVAGSNALETGRLLASHV